MTRGIQGDQEHCSDIHRYLLLHERLGHDALRSNRLFDAAHFLYGVISILAVVGQKADDHLSLLGAVRFKTLDERFRSDKLMERKK